MRRSVASKRAGDDRGVPFTMPPPDLEAPPWFFDADESPRTISEPPTMPATGIGAPGHDALGRYVGEKPDMRTPEEKLTAMQKKSWWKP